MSTSESTLDAEVQRLVKAEIDREEQARTERIKAQVLERQADEQRREGLRKRIADERDQDAQLREQAAQLRAEAESHLAALEAIEGGRPMLGRSRSVSLEEQVNRLELNAEDLEWRLSHP